MPVISDQFRQKLYSALSPFIHRHATPPTVAQINAVIVDCTGPYDPELRAVVEPMYPSKIVLLERSVVDEYNAWLDSEGKYMPDTKRFDHLTYLVSRRTFNDKHHARTQEST